VFFLCGVGLLGDDFGVFVWSGLRFGGHFGPGAATWAGLGVLPAACREKTAEF